MIISIPNKIVYEQVRQISLRSSKSQGASKFLPACILSFLKVGGKEFKVFFMLPMSGSHHLLGTVSMTGLLQEAQRINRGQTRNQ